MNIACIGCGNMGAALMKSAVKSEAGKSFFLHDTDREKSAILAAELKEESILCGKNSVNIVECSGNIEAVQKADFIFLAVKPQIMKDVLDEISELLKQRCEKSEKPVLVSMAAGWSIFNIQSVLNSIPETRVIRMMPNTPALISKGMIAIASSKEVPEEKTNELEKILCASGIIDRIEEKYLDAVTGLSGSGPAFVYLFIEALADGGVLSGLPRDKALRYAAQTVFGSAAMVLETGKGPGELKDMVCSPGGTTISGIKALENGAFRGTVINAVEAAWKRAVELGK